MRLNHLLTFSFMAYFFTVFSSDGSALIQDTPILRALADIESGNNPKAIGKYGEVSAYQILPSLWRSEDLFPAAKEYYRHPNAAAIVAQSILTKIFNHWNYNVDPEKRKLQPRDLYVIWHRGWKYYKHDHFLNFELLPKKVKDRALRYERVYYMYLNKTTK